ncbi:MAG: MATE family efflux transporter [Prevotellaceae bacterium]|nr:MATE family efflux transporter [Prevotellaceae bacterium]MDD7376572.1 MATE family efflux transporter [Prevotellaceae bacterium]MDY4759343.1 MATE family efflux transporter [Bacteroidaceae bacterium]
MTTDKKLLTELSEKPVFSLLLQYAIPAIVAMVASSLYNIVDGIFIGQGVGAGAIMGLAITMPIMNLSAAFGAMVGVGGSTLLSVKLGEKDYNFAAKILGNVITLNCIIGIGLGAVMLLFLDPILRFFGASDYTIPYARDFMVIVLIGNVFTHLFLGLNAMLRSSGKPKKAMKATIMTVIINIALAPLFIFVLHLGIRGAALATILSQLIVLLWQFKLFSNPDELIHLRRDTYRLERRIVTGSLSIGLSPFLINLCACIVVIIINKQLVSYGGDVAVGAYGIANRMMFFFVMVVIGINQGMQPIAGFNFGAKHYTRLNQVLKYAITIATGIWIVGFIVCVLLATPVASAFTNDEELLKEAAHALRVMNLVVPIIGFQMITIGFFQSIGKAGISIFLSLTRQLLFLVPLLLILPNFFGLEGIWYSVPIADGTAAITAAIVLIYHMRKFKMRGKLENSNLQTEI